MTENHRQSERYKRRVGESDWERDIAFEMARFHCVPCTWVVFAPALPIIAPHARATPVTKTDFSWDIATILATIENTELSSNISSHVYRNTSTLSEG